MRNPAHLRNARRHKMIKQLRSTRRVLLLFYNSLSQRIWRIYRWKAGRTDNACSCTRLEYYFISFFSMCLSSSVTTLVVHGRNVIAPKKSERGCRAPPIVAHVHKSPPLCRTLSPAPIRILYIYTIMYIICAIYI